MAMNEEGTIHQILVKLLDGNHKFLNLTTPSISIQTLKQKIQTLTSIPSHFQLLLLNQSLLHDDHQTLNLLSPGWPHQTNKEAQLAETLNSNGRFPLVVHLLLRLRGGKGGFGSLLRGAATKAGQKKTNNFDACRDMSGRRLRHVNAEKKLEEWRAEAEERKLEKMAEEFIKKKAKEMGKKGTGKGGVDTDKYVQKYREDSAKCMEEVDRSVRESLKGFVASKRKGASEDNETNAKRLKIWYGKRKLGDSDSEDMDEDESDQDEDEENNKSVVIDNGDHSDSSKEAGGSSGSVTEAQCDIVSSDAGASESGSEEEKDAVVEESRESSESKGAHEEAACLTEPELGISEEKTFLDGDKFCLQTSIVGSEAAQVEKEVSNKSGFSNVGGRVIQAPSVSGSGVDEASVLGVGSNSISNLAIQCEVVTTSEEALNSEKPLNFEEIDSAAELEVYGMERLKTELQARVLKCGGTLQERAARLFLLKTTPIEMLPKKLLAKK